MVRASSVRVVNGWVAQHRNGPRRAVSATSGLLTLVCALHKAGSLIPSNQRLAEWLNTEGYARSANTWTVEEAIIRADALREIDIRWRNEPGKIEDHPIRRLRHLVPCRALLLAYEASLQPE